MRRVIIYDEIRCINQKIDRSSKCRVHKEGITPLFSATKSENSDCERLVLKLESHFWNDDNRSWMGVTRDFFINRFICSGSNGLLLYQEKVNLETFHHIRFSDMKKR